MKKAEAIDHFGSPALLAKALNITVQAIWQWDEEVPLLRQYQLERITAGALKADTDKAMPERAAAPRA